MADADPSLQPFFTIGAEAGSDRLICQNRFQPGKTRRLDRLNALCEPMAALALALPEADQSLICLHAAAVKFSGQLLLFPNLRRAAPGTRNITLSGVQGSRNLARALRSVPS